MNARGLRRVAVWIGAPAVLAFMCTQPPAVHAASGGAGFAQLARACAPNVDPDTLAALVRTESDFNPYAIGVVGGHLQRQPGSLDEARATARELAARGFSYSVGLAQVNDRNFAKYGLDDATMFEPCRNLQAGGAILTECFARSSSTGRPAQAALRAALSCYYSGNFTTGFSSGYVSRVVASARSNAHEGGIGPIPVVRDAPPPEQIRPIVTAAAPLGHARKPDAPSCGAHPVVMMCRGLPAADARRLCVRCLDR
ncbi:MULTISPECIES: lytic transglycosylase domain-containing protein [Burkholderia cepacia complex]|uniref:lytic transglycosylase domain-containing protein n=1 Tax=Burkholderia stagnalis TaxID=1503054 RepID=UPI000F80E6BC